MALPKLVAFDVDGTLITYDGVCSDRTRAVIAELREAGVAISIATGRPLAALEETMDLIGQFDFAVCGNGGVVVDVSTGATIRQSTIAGATTERIVRSMRTKLPGIGTAVDVGDRTIEEHGFERRVPPRSGIVAVDDVLEALGSPCPDVARLVFFHDDFDHDLPGLARVLASDLDDTTEIFHGVILPIVEVIPAGDNKAVGLDALTAHLGVTAADTMAFGDGANDLEMLAWVGTGVAMANSADVTLEQADVVTASVEDDGVAVFLEQLLAAEQGSTT